MIKLDNGERVIHANLLVHAIKELRFSPTTGKVRRWVPLDEVLAIIQENACTEVVSLNTHIEDGVTYD